MNQYVKIPCREIIYEVLIGNKVVYHGNDKMIVDAVLEAHLERKQQDIYIKTTTTTRYMLVDIEEEVISDIAR